MATGNGHAPTSDDLVLAELERMAQQIADMRSRVAALKDRRRHCLRCERILSGASRGGKARAAQYQNDARRAQALTSLAELSEQNPRWSFSQLCAVVGKEIGVSRSTIYRWSRS